MKTFDEEFPSLKGHQTYLNKGDVMSGDGIYFLDFFIKEFCLDKAKVRDAILKMPIKASIEPLLKELGLERGKMNYITRDSGERVLFKSGMNRDNDGQKTRYDLLYIPMLKRWAELMARGADKYGERNWEKANSKEEMNRFKASAFRHFIQWFMDENDEDHGSAVFFNISGAELVKEKLKNENSTNKDN